MTNSVDWTKPIQTRGGRPVRHLMKLEHPTGGGGHTRVAQNTVDGCVWTCREDGHISANQTTGFDIFNVPEPAPSADGLLRRALSLIEPSEIIREPIIARISAQTLANDISAYLSAKDAKP